MPARTATTPGHFLTAPPPANAPIERGRNTGNSRTRHHCPHKLNGLHCLNSRCLTKKHVGYCETCKYLASPYHGCNKCGTRRLSGVPPSHVSWITSEGKEGVAQNTLVTGKDVLCKDGEDEDEGWTKRQEKKAREEAKARAVQEKENKRASKAKDASEARIEEMEKARKEQQKQTDRNRLTKGIKGLFRR